GGGKDALAWPGRGCRRLTLLLGVSLPIASETTPAGTSPGDAVFRPHDPLRPAGGALHLFDPQDDAGRRGPALHGRAVVARRRDHHLAVEGVPRQFAVRDDEGGAVARGEEEVALGAADVLQGRPRALDALARHGHDAGTDLFALVTEREAFRGHGKAPDGGRVERAAVGLLPGQGPGRAWSRSPPATTTPARPAK